MSQVDRNKILQSDPDLIRACRVGDASAWERLLDKYERLVFSISLNHGLTADDAADVTQITFTILLQNLDSLPDDVRLAPWLATVARRHCKTKSMIDHLRYANIENPISKFFWGSVIL